MDVREGAAPSVWRTRRDSFVEVLACSERAYVSVKLTVTVTIASKPIGLYFHCLTASVADRVNASFVDRRTVTSPIVPSP
jgi:hypothetical protein